MMQIQAPDLPEIETFTVPVEDSEWKQRLALLLRDPETSHWLRRALVGAAMSPPDQAVKEAEQLLRLMKKRAWKAEVAQAVRMDLGGDTIE